MEWSGKEKKSCLVSLWSPFMDETFRYKTEAIWLFLKRKKCEYKSHCGKTSVEDCHQGPASAYLCVSSSVSWAVGVGEYTHCQWAPSHISAIMQMCWKIFWTNSDVLLAFMCSHGIRRDTSTAQSCCYEQESDSIIFQNLFPLKAHVYILKRCPQALSQNQYIFMLQPILPNTANSSPRSKQIKEGNAASNQQRQKRWRDRWEKP